MKFEVLASKRGGHSTVMNRLVPELLSQMDGFSVSDRSDILILAATNRLWDIDSAFLRPPG
ncbi:MAG: AAA family ATPase [Lachnospiraceae bacterium]|nr:AAA family ATPase [Lachnospiraceae bacterium]